MNSARIRIQGRGIVMKLISWNMNQRSGNWTVLADLMQEHDATAAMVQEAVAPPPATRERLCVLGDPPLQGDPWRMPVPTGTRRSFASAIAVRVGVPKEVWAPVPLAHASYGDPAISHPGQWVAVGIGQLEKRVWLVSLYGLWETMPDNRDIFADATLHRAVSDLAVLFKAKATKRIVVAGDLNIWRGYGHKKWEPRYRTVFDRLAAHGLALAGPHRTVGAPLDRCPCHGGAACSHVRTYRPRHAEDSTPYQNDFVFARDVQVERCEALDAEHLWKRSDHCPILVELKGL